MKMNKESTIAMLDHFKILVEAFNKKERNFPSIKSELDNELIHYRAETDSVINLLKEDENIRAEYVENFGVLEDGIEFSEVKKMCFVFDDQMEEPIFGNFVQNVIEDLNRVVTELQ